MKESERHLLVELRRGLLQLHKTLLDWERAAYERVHGRVSGGELLKVIVSDPQFAWLRPVSELIVRIDETLEAEAPDVAADVDAIVAQARALIAPGEGHTSGDRYYTALQENPDVVFAHRDVAQVLKEAGAHLRPRETLH